MKLCPSCREEFLDHVDSCGVCHVDLVSEASAQALLSSEGLLSKEELLMEETVNFVEAGLVQCRELEKLLALAKISSVVYPVTLNAQNNEATLGSTNTSRYMVILRLADVERAKAALEGQFMEQVAKEGQGQFVRGVIDLAEHIITCPACGEANPLKDGECPACGLFLGAIEQSKRQNENQ